MICFVYFLLDYRDLMRGFYCTPHRKTLFVGIMFCFFLFFFFSFQLIFFFLIFFNINFFLFSYHSFMTRPCNQTHIQGSWVWCCSQTQDSWAALQTNLLKLKSCNFNIVINIKNNIICIINITISIIINIINITLRLRVAAISKTLGFSFANRPNWILDLFYIFYVKKNNP
jgi:hypothetical protein